MDRHRCLEPATGLGRSRDMSPTGDVPHGQISPPQDAASAPSKSTTEREWSAIACRRLFLAASLVKVAALLLWRVRARDLVLPHWIVDNSAFSPTCLTIAIILAYSAVEAFHA